MEGKSQDEVPPNKILQHCSKGGLKPYVNLLGVRKYGLHVFLQFSSYTCLMFRCWLLFLLSLRIHYVTSLLVPCKLFLCFVSSCFKSIYRLILCVILFCWVQRTFLNNELTTNKPKYSKYFTRKLTQ